MNELWFAADVLALFVPLTGFVLAIGTALQLALGRTPERMLWRLTGRIRRAVCKKLFSSKMREIEQLGQVLLPTLRLVERVVWVDSETAKANPAFVDLCARYVEIRHEYTRNNQMFNTLYRWCYK